MVSSIAIEELGSRLMLGSREHVALVGGGGASLLMRAIVGELSGPTVLTTTTRVGVDEFEPHPAMLAPSDGALRLAVNRHGCVVVASAERDGRLVGVDAGSCDRWFHEVVDHVVVKADGARGRPFTAPHTFEPTIPATATLVVCCLGGAALGRVIADQCHRPMRVAAVAGCSPYQRLTPERAAAVLMSERGSRKSVPDDARFVVVVNDLRAPAEPFVAELAECLKGVVSLIATRPAP